MVQAAVAISIDLQCVPAPRQLWRWTSFEPSPELLVDAERYA
jgi:hypothetical protein